METKQYILCNMYVPTYNEKILYLSGVITHRYLSHPIAMIANEDRKIGICCAVKTRLQSVAVSGPKGHCWNSISQRLTGKDTMQRKKSEKAKVPMKELWTVRMFFRQNTAMTTKTLPQLPMLMTTMYKTKVT